MIYKVYYIYQCIISTCYNRNQLKTMSKFEEYSNLCNKLIFKLVALKTIEEEAVERFISMLNTTEIKLFFGKNVDITMIFDLPAFKKKSFYTRIYLFETIKEAHNFINSDVEYLEEKKLPFTGNYRNCSFHFCMKELEIGKEKLFAILKECITIVCDDSTCDTHDFFVYQKDSKIYIEHHLKKIYIVRNFLTEVINFENCENYDTTIILDMDNQDTICSDVVPQRKNLSKPNTHSKKYSITIFDNKNNVEDAFTFEGNLDAILSKCTFYGNGTLAVENDSKIIKYNLH